jgi:hypothetical protein
MTFHVSFTNAEEQHYADEDVYEFREGGVLAIRRADDVFMDEYWAPNAWEYVSTSRGHRPGRPGGPAPELSSTVPD